jgi:hypothetical protein
MLPQKMRTNETMKMWNVFTLFSDVCDILVTPRNDALFLLGDFNEKIGKEHSNKRVAGRHTLYNIASKNEEKLVQLAVAHNLEISSTKFKRRRIHKGTWKVPGQTFVTK